MKAEAPDGVASFGREEMEMSRKDQPMRFGDDDFEVEDEYGEATWQEVFESCCVHSVGEWGMIFLGIGMLLFFLYFFLVGLDLLGSGAKVLCGCKAGELFGDDTNPIAGLMIGILATVLLQSSSTTTSIIVSLVGSAISVRQGIYMVMGANIGTSITNTIVALGQVGDVDMLERAVSGATVHDLFNFMTVGVLLPLELITGYLFRLTEFLVKNAETEKGDKWEGPIKKLVSPLGSRVIKANKNIIKAIANGKGSCSDGDGFYPIVCEAGDPTYETCSSVGLIACDKKTNKCPMFFQVDADASEDKISGGVVFFIGLCTLFTCLLCLVSVLQRMLLGMSTRIVYKATDVNGYVAMLVGAGITIVVQSSSITTSTLTPLVGMGAIRLEQMFPLTLGANVGTTVTALMSAMVTDGTKSLQVALAHLFFNLTGIVLFYPIPVIRRIPLAGSRFLGSMVRYWRGFPVLYIAVMFFGAPLMFLGISLLFEQGHLGYTVLGVLLVLVIVLFFIYTSIYCKYQGGDEMCIEYMKMRERRREMAAELPFDVEYLKEQVALLAEHTGLPSGEGSDAGSDDS